MVGIQYRDPESYELCLSLNPCIGSWDPKASWKTVGNGSGGKNTEEKIQNLESSPSFALTSPVSFSIHCGSGRPGNKRQPVLLNLSTTLSLIYKMDVIICLTGLRCKLNDITCIEYLV